MSYNVTGTHMNYDRGMIAQAARLVIHMSELPTTAVAGDAYDIAVRELVRLLRNATQEFGYWSDQTVTLPACKLIILMAEGYYPQTDEVTGEVTARPVIMKRKGA